MQNQQKQLATQISEVDLCPEGLSPVSIELLSSKLVLAGIKKAIHRAEAPEPSRPDASVARTRGILLPWNVLLV